MTEHPYSLTMTPELARKLRGLLITEDDVRGCIDHCSATGLVARDGPTGHLVCHRRLGEVTYWVEYDMAGSVCTVHNAYSHRMRIAGE